MSQDVFTMCKSGTGNCLVVFLVSCVPYKETADKSTLHKTTMQKKAEIAGLLVQREPLACTCIVLRADTPCAKKLAIKGKKANVPDNYLIPFLQ